MASETSPKHGRPAVSKLLRVLVAGGIALAGATTHAAEPDKAATQKPVGDKPEAEKAAEKAAAAKKAEKAAEKKAADEKKAAADAGGGVKGW
jgi:hypothetical protein